MKKNIFITMFGKDTRKRKRAKKTERKQKNINAGLIRIIIFSFLGVSILSFVIAFSNTGKSPDRLGSTVVGRLGNAPGYFAITSRDFKDREIPVNLEEVEEIKGVLRPGNIGNTFRMNLKNNGYSAAVRETESLKDSTFRTPPPVADKVPEKNTMLSLLPSVAGKRLLSSSTTGIYAQMQAGAGSDSGLASSGVRTGFSGINSVNEISNMVQGALSIGQNKGTAFNAEKDIVPPQPRLPQNSREQVLASSLLPPVSRHVIQAGTLIPVTMITGINSDLPGDIIGQITRNIYDSIRGKYLLIPAGSKLLGSYNSSVLFGQKRLFVLWSRLLRPDGSSLDLRDMRGVDMEGYAGYSDKVDEHWDKIMASLGIATLINIANMEVRGQTEKISQFSNSLSAGADSLSNQIDNLAGKILDKSLNIQPTLHIRPGLRVNMFVSKDIVLSEYE